MGWNPWDGGCQNVVHKPQTKTVHMDQSWEPNKEPERPQLIQTHQGSKTPLKTARRSPTQTAGDHVPVVATIEARLTKTKKAQAKKVWDFEKMESISLQAASEEILETQ